MSGTYRDSEVFDGGLESVCDPISLRNVGDEISELFPGIFVFDSWMWANDRKSLKASKRSKLPVTL
jgi:hypothetical protein